MDLKFENNEELKLIVKYVFDGTNVNCYKQRTNNSNAYTDSVFCVSLLPVQLKNKHTGEIYWVNPRPSSTRFCRPIKISFEKETVELCRREEEYLKQQIQNLESTQISGCTVESEMILTMIDEKVHNHYSRYFRRILIINSFRRE